MRSVSALHWTIAILAAYLAGSIPFGLIIGRFHGIDIREHGSKNIGATNVWRVLGRGAGLLCFFLDMLKGALPVLIVGWYSGLITMSIAQMPKTQMMLWLAVAIAPVIGHMYSLFIGGKGGKGVATGFGALLAMWPLMTFPVLGALVAWYAVLRITKFVSLASIIGAASVPVFLIFWLIPADGKEIGRVLLHAWPPIALSVVLAFLVTYKHRANIGRMMRGEEPRIGRRTPTKVAETRPNPQ